MAALTQKAGAQNKEFSGRQCPGTEVGSMRGAEIRVCCATCGTETACGVLRQRVQGLRQCVRVRRPGVRALRHGVRDQAADDLQRFYEGKKSRDGGGEEAVKGAFGDKLKRKHSSAWVS
eukprot:3663167-Rhodomonas_salina.2